MPQVSVSIFTENSEDWKLIICSCLKENKAFHKSKEMICDALFGTLGIPGMVIW